MSCTNINNQDPKAAIDECLSSMETLDGDLNQAQTSLQKLQSEKAVLLAKLQALQSEHARLVQSATCGEQKNA